MRWRGRRQSENIEDRRSMSAGPVIAGGGILTLLLIVFALFMGVDPMTVLNQQAPVGAPVDQPAEASGEPDELSQFVRTVLADTEDVWTTLLEREGQTYRPPTLVLFTNQVQSACGFASAAMGPFYCPADQKVYIDLQFYRQLKDDFGAPGEFAQAYVLAHEVGHHVQNLLGISDQVRQAQSRASQTEGNELSVRLELQADFFAGVWAHHAHRMHQILEPGDLEQGLRAASAIGDDRLQRRSQGYVVPDSFTHGSSEQRVRWFRLGLQSGNFTDGNTFETDKL